MAEQQPARGQSPEELVFLANPWHRMGALKGGGSSGLRMPPPAAAPRQQNMAAV